MDGVSLPVPLWLPAFDIEAAADAVEEARLWLAHAARVGWVSAAADEFRAEIEGLQWRVEALEGHVEEARVAWRLAQDAAERAGQW